MCITPTYNRYKKRKKNYSAVVAAAAARPAYRAVINRFGLIYSSSTRKLRLPLEHVWSYARGQIRVCVCVCVCVYVTIRRAISGDLSQARTETKVVDIAETRCDCCHTAAGVVMEL